ncbi:MAG: hypothetical protein RL488_1136 [Actinomycetota bacterium]|jgi:pimeloyl-ACP methyl ester carboxylesterase
MTHKLLKRIAAGIAAITIVAALAGCSNAEPPKRDLTKYQAQTVTWSKCSSDLLLDASQRSDAFNAGDVTCATVLAPATYTGNDKVKDFSLSLMRLHVASKSDFMGTIFINPGGPGGSGVEQLQWSPFPADLLAHYDIVGFDPRGVGKSTFADGTEIKCTDSLDYVTYFSGESSPANEAEYLGNQKPQDNYFKDCTKKNPLWWTLSTDHVVDDLELMRQVVTGKADLNFIGTSYGTTIAGMYVTKYPKHVGKIVLDSPTTVSSDAIASAVEDAKSMESKLDLYLNAYAKHAKITPEVAWKRLLEMRELADNDGVYGYAGIEPSGVSDGEMISSEYLITHGIQALSYYSEGEAIPAFVSAMDDLYNYHWNAAFEWFAFQLDGYDPQSLKGASLKAKKLVRSNQYEIMTIVNTMDYSPKDFSVEEQKKMAKKVAAAAPKWTKLGLDSSGYMYYGPSSGLSWSSIAESDPAIPDPPTEPLKRENKSGKKLLIVGSTHEAVTPFSFAQDTAKLLKSPLISVDSATHGPAAGYDIPCLNQVLVDYFVAKKDVQSQSCPGH